jgi:RNA polymerase sigma-70 factor (ECF subfamily)
LTPSLSGDDGGKVRDVIVTLPVSFDAFHEIYHQAYLRYAHAQFGNRTDTEEVVEEAFTELALTWSHALRQPSPETYGWAVLRHRLAERLRVQQRELALVETAAFATEVLRAANKRFAILESRIGLYAAIARLPERQYDAIVLHYCLGYPTARTASIMGISQATVRSHLRLAKRRLARELHMDINLTDDAGDSAGTDE